jgi:hypothetical protein
MVAYNQSATEHFLSTFANVTYRSIRTAVIHSVLSQHQAGVQTTNSILTILYLEVIGGLFSVKFGRDLFAVVNHVLICTSTQQIAGLQFGRHN